MLGIIYGLYDPRKPDVIRYIGQTTQKPKKRLQRHIRDSKTEKYHRATWIKSILIAGFFPEMIVIDKPDFRDYISSNPRDILNNCEKYWIKHYRKLGQSDTNYSDGGNAISSDNAKEMRRMRAIKNNELTVEQKKEAILSLPVGSERPHHKDSLGKALSNYMCENSDCYDAEFTNEVKCRFPYWFQDHHAKVIKEELLSMPIGSQKPRQKIDKHGTILGHFLSKGGKSFDIEFYNAVKKRFPNWFRDDLVKQKKDLLLNRPATSSVPKKLRCSLDKYLNPSSSCYDKDFAEKYRKKFPNKQIKNK